jgi:hypothetical protein
MKWLALVAILLAGCAAPDDPTAAAGRGHDAEFRYNAGFVYDALLIGSCRARPGYDRSALLAAQREAMEAFEGSASAPVRAQLEVARIDLLYRHRAERICEDNVDPARAKQYLENAKRSAEGGVERLRALAPDLAFSIPREAIEAPRAAEFRFLVRKLADLFWAPCSSPAEKDALQAPARAELARFRKRLEGRPEAVNEAIASADAAWLHSITNVECSDGEPEPAARISRTYLLEAKRQIAAIEAMIGGR